MRLSPILLLHICSGTLGMLSGAVAVCLRKGSRRHGLAGDVFVISMLSLAVTGVYMAWVKAQPGNVLGGTLTFYLVATAWMTAKRKDTALSSSDWVALLVSSVLACFTLTCAFLAATSPTGMKYGYHFGPYLFLGSVALLSAIGDLRLLVLHGISGTPRIARHLWRMCFAWFIAAISIFGARQQLFPELMRKTGMLLLLSFLPLMLMIYWLVRVRFKDAYQGQGIARRDVVTSSPQPTLPVPL